MSLEIVMNLFSHFHVREALFKTSSCSVEFMCKSATIQMCKKQFLDMNMTSSFQFICALSSESECCANVGWVLGGERAVFLWASQWVSLQEHFMFVLFLPLTFIKVNALTHKGAMSTQQRFIITLNHKRCCFKHSLIWLSCSQSHILGEDISDPTLVQCDVMLSMRTVPSNHTCFALCLMI